MPLPKDKHLVEFPLPGIFRSRIFRIADQRLGTHAKMAVPRQRISADFMGGRKAARMRK
jgi:hypothetical protein